MVLIDLFTDNNLSDLIVSFNILKQVLEALVWEPLPWVCLMLAWINWYHMARWQDHSIFCVPEHHINHFLGDILSLSSHRNFPNSPCLYFSHTWGEFTYTDYTLALLEARPFDRVQAGAKQNVKVRCKVRLFFLFNILTYFSCNAVKLQTLVKWPVLD